MAESGTKRGRKRSAETKTPGKLAPRKKHRKQSDSENYYLASSSPIENVQKTSLVPLKEEDDAKLPEQFLKALCKEPGILLIAGLVSWDLVGKKASNTVVRTHPNLYSFHKFTEQKYRLIVSGCNSAHSIIVTEQGAVRAFGRNTNGQLGTGDIITKDFPEEIVSFKDRNIIAAATGRNHTLLLSDAGIVYACGDNRSGQCGVGNSVQQLLIPARIHYSGAPIVKVGCGADFSLILDAKGNLYSFGLPEYGQLGHNTDGKFIVSSKKLSFHFELSPKRIILFIEKTKEGRVIPIKNVDIVDFACGTNHTVAIDTNKRAYSWGFGGFGRLGHAEPRDEFVPRLIKSFDVQGRGVLSVYCGSTYSLAINDVGGLFLFGQTKRTGEANMYPKPVHDRGMEDPKRGDKQHVHHNRR